MTPHFSPIPLLKPRADRPQKDSGLKKLLFFIVLLFPPINVWVQGNSFVWAKSSGGTNSHYANAITADSAGNIYLTGRFSYTGDFNPGPATYNLTAPGLGFPNAFVQKLDADGNFMWAQGYGNSGSESGSSVTTDGTTAIYLAGTFQGTVDFIPGLGSFALTSNGGEDVYVLKLDLAGNFIWGKSFGDASDDGVDKVILDLSGNVYLIGNTSDTLIRKLDPDGNLIWSGTVPVYSTSSGYCDHAGNIYVAGIYGGTPDFDPGPGTYFDTSNGDLDVFLLKLDSSGSFLWTKTFGSIDEDACGGVTVDPSGNVYLNGAFREVADFDPGAGVYNLDCDTNFQEIFVLKLDSAGNFIWAVSAETDIAYCSSIALDNVNSVYIAGGFDEFADFDPGSGVYNMTGQNWDMFAMKLDSTGNFVWAKSAGGSSSDGIRDIAIDSTGNLYLAADYKYIADIAPGSPVYTQDAGSSSDICAIKLAPCISDLDVETATACNSFTWIDGITYFSSTAIPKMYYTNQAGCDSILGLDLTILANAIGVDTVVACDNYTWLDGITYFSDNTTASYILPAAAFNGCDSIVMLNLTINYPNTVVFNNDPNLVANSWTATYQWLDCLAGYSEIPGANAQMYIAALNGSYAVEITENGCTDTSACQNVVSLPTANVPGFELAGTVWCDWAGLCHLNNLADENTFYSVCDLSGKIIAHGFIKSSEELIDLSTFSSGIYILTVLDEKKPLAYKLMNP
jgi:hypothetical protein